MSTLPAKTVLITGANAGIGKDVARQLASRPEIARIYLACRNRGRATTAKAELEADTGRRLDRIAAAFAVAEPGALPGKRVRDLTSDANLRLARSTPCNPPAFEFDSPLRG